MRIITINWITWTYKLWHTDLYTDGTYGLDKISNIHSSVQTANPFILIRTHRRSLKKQPVSADMSICYSRPRSLDVAGLICLFRSHSMIHCYFKAENPRAKEQFSWLWSRHWSRFRQRVTGLINARFPEEALLSKSRCIVWKRDCQINWELISSIWYSYITPSPITPVEFSLFFDTLLWN